MIIILVNMPVGTSTKTIQEFISPVLKGGFFKKRGHIDDIAIQIHEDTQHNIINQHALVRITPDAAVSS